MYNGPGLYEHYKGDTYYVYGPSTHTETGEVCVAYTDGLVGWHRPLEHFNRPVDTEGGTIERFAHMVVVKLNDE